MSKKVSRKSRLLELLSFEKRALKFADVLDGYARLFPGEVVGHEALSSALGALLHSGEVTRVGRGRGLVRYRLAARPRSNVPDRGRMTSIVYDIVDLAYRTTLAPISTGEIRRALQLRGAWPDRFPRLIALLESMAIDALDPWARGQSAARSAAVLRRAAAALLRGNAPGFWLPSWAPLQCAISASTASDALRYAIAAASRESGMPVSQREIRQWIAAQPPESWWRGHLTPARTGAALRNVALRDQSRRGEAHAVHVIEGPLTAHGGAPKRYCVGEPDDVTARLCHITDAVLMLDLGTELAVRATMRQLALPEHIRRRLERARDAAVLRALDSYCGTFDATTLSSARRRRGRCLRATLSWQSAASSSPVSGHAFAKEQRSEYASWRAMLTLVRKFATETESRRRRRDEVDIVGRAGLLTPAEALRWAGGLESRGVITSRRPALIYATARRFPTRAPRPAEGGRPERLPPGDGLALLDAVDVWCALRGRAERGERGQSRCCFSWKSIPIALGTVLRDAGVIEELRAISNLPHESREMFAEVAKLLQGRVAEVKRP